MSNIIGSRISIPSILKVGSGTLQELGRYLKEKGLNNVVVYFGNGLIDMLGSVVMDSFKENQVTVLDVRELDTTDINDIIELAFGIDAKTQAILGIGGGKVIDVAKYAAYLRKMPFISVPTSASSDGFSSSSASLLVEGKRTSVPARIAYGIVVDTDVIKSAPDKFIYSGIGDLVSKITALYDWKYEDSQGYDTLNDFAMMIAKKAVNSFVRTTYESNSIKDDLFLRELVDSLALSGIANEIAGNSAPASGSEHLISHALDKICKTPQLHGVQVGLATYLMSMVQEHRVKRIHKIFTDTGFFEFAATLDLDRDEFMRAIDIAPSIKPYRHTYIHEEQYRQKAKEILVTDPEFEKIFS